MARRARRQTRVVAVTHGAPPERPPAAARGLSPVGLQGPQRRPVLLGRQEAGGDLCANSEMPRWGAARPPFCLLKCRTHWWSELNGVPPKFTSTQALGM